MNDNKRFIQIVTQEIQTEKLKCEEDLEKVVNDSSIETHLRVNTVKNLLEHIVKYDNMLQTWIGYMLPNQDNNENNDNDN